MEFSSFFEVIATYGWESVAIALTLGLIYLALKFIGTKIADNVQTGMETVGEKISTNIVNQNEALSASITNQNNELIKAISNQNERLLSYLMHKDVVEEELHDRRVEKRMEFAENINDKLKEIMHLTHSQRAFIIEFHNSYKNLAGSPFAKYTCTYEWFDKGLDQISTKISGLPYSTMAKIVGDVKRTGKHQKLYTDIEKMEIENPQLFSLVKDPRTKAIFYNSLYDENNKLTGMLVIEWQNKFNKDVFYDAKMDHVVAEESIQLSTWLNLIGPTIESEILDEDE